MTTTSSGLKYRDIKVGNGKEAQPGQTVQVHYTGRLWENDAPGKEFDSSHSRNVPFEFQLGESMVIAGWDEGVAGMKVGGKRELVIPPTLGYGRRGAGNGLIPPNATLYFEVELLDVSGKARPKMDTTSMNTEPSGLKWERLQAGTGTVAEKDHRVTVHYTGWLFENGFRGKKFDSSKDRNRPFTFNLGQGQVIEGWDLGVAGMKEGEKRLLLIPPALAYGNRQMGKDIKPNSTLLFEVELLETEPLPSDNPEAIDLSRMTTTDSGLMYEVTQPGSGAEAKAGNTVSVHYTGKLFENGKATKKFDSSLDRGQPIQFPLGEGRVIKGWDEGISGMKVGEKRRLVIPPNLAYGNRQMGPDIKPNSTLYFEVELVDVK